MNGRLISGFVALLVLAPVAAGLLFGEEFVSSKETVVAAATALDPLAALVYARSSRDENVKKMGFDDAQTAKVIDFMAAAEKKLSIGDPDHDVFMILLQQTDDAQLLENALCGRLKPARYTALQLLVEEEQGELKMLDLTGVPRFEPQEWYDKDMPVRIASDLDIVPNRQADATRMGLAAVFARQVTTALDHQAPWGQSLFSGWSWDGVKKKWPAVEDKVERYVATFHLLMENVTADGGFCRTQ